MNSFYSECSRVGTTFDEDVVVIWEWPVRFLVAWAKSFSECADCSNTCHYHDSLYEKFISFDLLLQVETSWSGIAKFLVYSQKHRNLLSWQRKPSPAERWDHQILKNPSWALHCVRYGIILYRTKGGQLIYHSLGLAAVLQGQGTCTPPSCHDYPPQTNEINETFTGYSNNNSQYRPVTWPWALSLVTVYIETYAALRRQILITTTMTTQYSGALILVKAMGLLSMVASSFIIRHVLKRLFKKQRSQSDVDGGIRSRLQHSVDIVMSKITLTQSIMLCLSCGDLISSFFVPFLSTWMVPKVRG